MLFTNTTDNVIGNITRKNSNWHKLLLNLQHSMIHDDLKINQVLPQTYAR